MKRVCYSLGLIVLFLISSANSCHDTGEQDFIRDPNLYGYWQAINSQGQIFSWEFNRDGTAVQTTPDTSIDYSWWETRGEFIQLTWSGGVTERITSIEYKIEGRNQLYLWVEQANSWSAPYTRTAN